MAFTVDSAALRHFAATMGDLARQAQRARDYTDQHLAITAAQGNIFANVVAQAAELREVLGPNYARMAGVLDQAARELDRSAAAYEATDTSGAATLDATYPTTGR